MSGIMWPLLNAGVEPVRWQNFQISVSDSLGMEQSEAPAARRELKDHTLIKSVPFFPTSASPPPSSAGAPDIIDRKESRVTL